MPSSDERRKGLRARLPLEFFFNILGASEEYTRGQVSIVKRLAAIDAIKISAPKTEAQALLTRIDHKLSLLVGLMADRFTHKNYLHQAVVHDISEFGLAFGHTLDMPNGAPLELGLKLAAGDQFMDIGGKIVHVKPPQDHSSGYAHIYGVEFTDIQSSDQNEIVQWIFTHQREQIRRRRENS